MSLPNKTTRRTFLGGAAVTAAATTFHGPAIFADGVLPSAKMNLGMIGVGGKGETNLLTFHTTKNAQVVAICDVDEAHAAKAFANPKFTKYHDYREMLEKEKGLDGVVVTTPDHHHAAASILVMQHGLHCYTEKPMAHSIYEARRMAEVAKQTGRVTQMGNHGHAGRVLRRAVEILQAGAIGKVKEMHAWTDRPSWKQGIAALPDPKTPPETLQWNLWLGPAAERPYGEGYNPRVWRGWWDFGTGSLGDMACHVMDLGFWGLKLGYPSAIEVKETSGATPYSPPAWSILNYEFPQRGDLPPVTLTWYDGDKKPGPDVLQRAGITEALPGNGSIIIGDEGTMYVPETYGAKYVLLPEAKFAGYNPAEMVLPVPTTHYSEWVEACRGGSPTMSSFQEYGGLLTETVLTGNLALRLGKRVEWDGPNMKSPNCPEADQYIHPVMREGWKI